MIGGVRVRRIALTVALGCLAASATLAGSPKAAVASVSHGTLHTVGAAANAGLMPSRNWSGLAVTGKTYRQVAGSWKVPTVIATPGSRYASDWAGIGQARRILTATQHKCSGSVRTYPDST